MYTFDWTNLSQLTCPSKEKINLKIITYLLNIILHNNIFVKSKVSNCNELQDNAQYYSYWILLSIIEESSIRTGEKMRILLGKIFGVCYSVIISVCLVYVKRQTSYFFYLHSTIQNQQYQRIERQVRGSAKNKVVVHTRLHHHL